MTKHVKEFPAVDVIDTETVQVVSHNLNLELCYNFVSRIANALPPDERDTIKARLKGTQSTGDIAQLAVEVAQDSALVERALSISDDNWSKVNRATKGDVRQELRLVLDLIQE